MDVLSLGYDTAVGLFEREYEAARETKVWMLFYVFLPFLWGSQPCDGHAGLEVEFRKLSRSVFCLPSFGRFVPNSMVKGRIREAVRASKSYSSAPRKLYVYIRYVYTDSRKHLTEVGSHFDGFNYLHLSAGSIIVLPRRHLAGKLFNLFSA